MTSERDTAGTPSGSETAAGGADAAAESPYGIGAAPDDDAAETGPTPVDTDLEDRQVEGRE